MTNKQIPRKIGITMTIALLLITSTFFVGQAAKPAFATPPINLYVGYADDARAPSASFPTPWCGSPNAIIIGACSGIDAGVIRIDNPGTSPITVNNVVVTLPGTGSGPSGNRPATINYLSTSTIIPPGKFLIISQTAPEFGAQDTSDYQVTKCGFPDTNSADSPQVTVTVNSITSTFTDTGRVLDTGGFDLACLHNESTPWTLIGGSPPSYSEQLFVNGLPLTGSVPSGTTVTEVAQSTDVTVTNFIFHWKDSSNNEVRTTPTTTNTDSFAPTTPGNWNVCVDFLSGTKLDKTVCSPFTVLALPTATVTTSSQIGNDIPSTSVTDSATVTGSGTAPLPDLIGTVSFQLCGPNPSASTSQGCVAAGSVPITTNGGTFTAVSPAQAPTAAGFYCWTATYAPAQGAQFLGSSSTTTTNECFNVLTSVTQGRMTGGGSIIDPTVGKVHHGFELQCNTVDTPNNLEVNWGHGNKFHLTSLTTAFCVNDPTISPYPPAAGFDTYVGTGTGSYNDVAGATAQWTFTDAGEPGTNDHATIVIKDSSGNTVLSVSGNLEHGNQQAHNN